MDPMGNTIIFMPFFSEDPSFGEVLALEIPSPPSFGETFRRNSKMISKNAALASLKSYPHDPQILQPGL